LWNKKTKVIPIVIDALGAFSKRYSGFLKELHLESLNPYILQKTTILGTAAIL